MKKAIALTLAAVAAFLAADAAQAKELSSFRTCGAAGCRETRDVALLRQLIHAVELQGDPVSARTPAPAPFLRLEFVARSDDGTSASWSQVLRVVARPPGDRDQSRPLELGESGKLASAPRARYCRRQAFAGAADQARRDRRQGRARPGVL